MAVATLLSRLSYVSVAQSAVSTSVNLGNLLVLVSKVSKATRSVKSRSFLLQYMLESMMVGASLFLHLS